jgi:hypothetical protein
MENSQASQLANMVRQKMEDFKEVCENLDENTASVAPSGRWSPKEIVSHLCGPEGTGHVSTIRNFLEKDTPRIDIQVEDSFFSEHRAGMPFAEFLAQFEREYNGVAELVTGLSDEQLGRKAHMPFLKNSPLGEYPTLADWIQVIGDSHLGSHTDHMREILEQLGGTPEIPRKQEGQEFHASSGL